MLDDMDETFFQSGLVGATPIDFGRKEIVPGAFFEYEYDNQKKISMTAGLRADYHNLFGLLYAPRLHLKYNVTPTSTIRFNVGKGIRLANILTENTGFMTSSRIFLLDKQQTNKAYGFNPDVAWNYGASFSQDFNLNYRPGTISLDYYFTDFVNQVVADYDHHVHQITFFGLQGKSFSHSVQAQLDYQPIRRLDVRLAYRWINVKTDYLDKQLDRPLIPKYRAFVNIAYATKSNWKFDATVQRIGKQRLPNTSANPEEYELASDSDEYWNINTQVTKDMGKHWSVYLGIENLTNFRLKNPIVASNDPFSQYFDASMVWGPVFGRMAYTGFRFRIL
jgi:outer membrane receptor for ferrienterochelin and colicin